MSSGDQHYLEDLFQEEKRELERVAKTIDEVAGTLPSFVLDAQFPYEAKQGKVVKKGLTYSLSTNAMILFALSAVMNKVTESPLVPQHRVVATELGTDAQIGLKAVWDGMVAHILSEAQKFKKPGSDTFHISYSGSFGWDDPFTLSWIWELTRANVFTRSDEFALAIENVITRRLKQAWSGLYTEKSSLLSWVPTEVTEDTAGLDKDVKEQLGKRTRHAYESLEHAFPMLRYVHLYFALPPLKRADISTDQAVRFMEARLNEQLASAETKDGRFDASELVFAFEGLLLLNSGGLGSAVIDRVFEVIASTQQVNPYWRPVKPFVITPQGQVLFPLSVETANSLLRCCGLLEKKSGDVEAFSRNIALFKNYASWLRSRFKTGSAVSTNQTLLPFAGWHSEHVHLHEGIHLWETSQVLLFLVHYRAMLERHVADRSREAVGLSAKEPWKNSKPSLTHTAYWDSDSERKVGEPLETLARGSPYRAFDYGRELVASRTFTQPGSDAAAARQEPHYSALLYGPPGTGKTSFAEELCNALRWPLIVVTPSDFIRGGENEIEARAKTIFEVLEAQFDAVVLFDEIDRTIWERGTKRFERQNDIWQFMTPSMLTKLRDLRERQRVIFLVATNYADDIDPAAKRKGRIDRQLLIAPPDKQARLRILRNLISKTRRMKFVPSTTGEAALTEAANQTALMVFGELKAFYEDTINNVKTDVLQDGNKIALALAVAAAKVPQPAISITTYKTRIEEVKAQYPYDEIFVLVHLLHETGRPLGRTELEVTSKACSALLGWDVGKWDATPADQKKKVLKPALMEVLKRQEPLVESVLTALAQ